MKTTTKRVLFWAPRILCVLFAIFVSLFALDVFGEGYGFWGTLKALSIHLVPTAVLVIVLALSWRWEWVGGVLFITLGLAYIWMTHGRFPWTVYLVMSGTLFLLGVLFLINWFYHAELRAST